MPATRIILASVSDTLGGVELRLAMVAELLARDGHQPMVLINLHPAIIQWAEALRSKGIPVIHFDPPHFVETWQGRHLRKLWAKWFFGTRLRAYHADMIHVFMPWSDSCGSLLWLAHNSGLPILASIHNAFRSTPASAWTQAHYGQAFASVQRIYAISASALEHCEQVFGACIRPDTHKQVIHNGVDTSRFHANPELRRLARESLGVPPQAQVIGCIARLVKEKRHGKLLELFAQLKTTFPDLHLLLIGSGPLEAPLRTQAAALGVTAAVTFAGFQPHPETLIPAMDIHAMLSCEEGFCSALIEAMACGLPTIGTDVPGIRDVLSRSQGALLVPLQDDQATLAQFSQLLADADLRTHMGAQARQDVLTHFSLARWENRVRACYTQFLQELAQRQVHLSANSGHRVSRQPR